MPGSPRVLVSRIGVLLIALSMSCLTAELHAQIEDPVHITPQMRPMPKPADKDVVELSDVSALNAHTRPLRVDVDLVLVSVSVTDGKNHQVTGLQRENFTVLENEKQQNIQTFSVEDGPISVGLVLDLSGSMGNKVETERAAVGEFFRNANPDDDYFVVAFSDRPKLIATTTQSIGTIQTKISEEKPHGNTALLDAIYLALSHMRHARYERKALLIISDGGDNNSRYSLKDIKGLVQESNVDVYAIGIFDTALFRTFEEYMGRKWLSEITDASGGRTVTIDNLAKLPDAASAISWELRNQYVLGFRPEKGDRSGKWQKIKVNVTPPDPAGWLQAHYRRSYLVPAQ